MASDLRSQFLQLSSNTLPLSHRIGRDHAKRLIEPSAQINSFGQRTLRFGDGYRQLCHADVDHHASVEYGVQLLTSKSEETLSDCCISKYDKKSGSDCEKTYIASNPHFTPKASHPQHKIPCHETRRLLTLSDHDFETLGTHGQSVDLTLNQDTGFVEQANLESGRWTQENTPEAELDLYMAKLANYYRDLESHMIILLFQQYLSCSRMPSLTLKLKGDNILCMSAWDKHLCDVVARARFVHGYRLRKTIEIAKIARWASNGTPNRIIRP